MSSSEVEVTPNPDGRKKWLSMQVKPVSARTDEYAESLEQMAGQNCLKTGFEGPLHSRLPSCPPLG